MIIEIIEVNNLGGHKFETEIKDAENLTEQIKELTRAFMIIYKLKKCYFTLKGTSELGEEEKIGALFG